MKISEILDDFLAGKGIRPKEWKDGSYLQVQKGGIVALSQDNTIIDTHYNSAFVYMILNKDEYNDWSIVDEVIEIGKLEPGQKFKFSKGSDILYTVCDTGYTFGYHNEILSDFRFYANQLNKINIVKKTQKVYKV